MRADPGTPAASAGDHLRRWRRRRQLSQLDLALQAGVSQRHLSFLESGRAEPSRDMLLRLTERLDVPLRDRNVMLLAAGFAPVFTERSLDDPTLAAAREAIGRVLRGHEPFPALAVDRHWNLVAANAALPPLLTGVADQALLLPPINVLRLSLHPAGLASRIVNLPAWSGHLLDRLRRQAAVTADPALARLLDELVAYPAGSSRAEGTSVPADHGEIFVPLQLRTEVGLLSFLSTTTVFGTPRDITLSELAIEAFFPADAETARLLGDDASTRKGRGSIARE